MDNNNLNILVEAKKEYMDQLCMLMCPLMIQTFLDLYAEAQKMSKGHKVLLQYQKLLKEVPNWNNHIVKQHTGNLSNSCSWFSDLLAAVFVSCVKILSSVRLNTENKKISIKLPSNEVFVHGCYVAAAKDLYKDPYVYHEENSDYERDDILTKRFKECIEATVKEMIPVQQILQTYISQGEKMEEKNIDFDNDEPEDTEDPDVNDEPDSEPAPEPESEQEPEKKPEMETPQEIVDELKNIDVGKKPQLPEPEPELEDDDVLFPGAPDQKQNS
jgi:hypothetical protein